MRKIVILMLVFLFVPSVTLAGPKGKGQGRAKGGTESAEEVMEEVGKETVEVVADELLKEDDVSGTKGTPPGLSKKDKMPPGLEKKGKTPPGWEKGRKEGWTKASSGKAEEGSAIRRMIRRAFQRSKESSQADQAREKR